MFTKDLAKKYLLFAAICGLVPGCEESPPPATSGQSPTTPTTVTANRPETLEEPADPTNTGVNVRDRNVEEKTPFDQNEKQSDVTITAEIRKQVVGTEMSVDAQNVKIITQDGKVTLRGPVATEQEKLQVEKIATAVAGPSNVDSQLEVTNK